MLKTSTAALLLWIGCHSPFVLAHGGSHDSAGGVFQIVHPEKLPKAISLRIVKTNAEQFALATDGSKQVNVLDPQGRPFIRFTSTGVQADLNSPAWYRAQMPGGGKIPDRITPGLEPKWTPLNVDQPGLGWYDSRLLDEDSKGFELSLTVDGKPQRVSIKRMAPALPAGQWVNYIGSAPGLDSLTILLPQPRTAALMLQYSPPLNLHQSTKSGGPTAPTTAGPEAAQTLELLDDQGTAFIRFTGKTVEFKQAHKWAPQLQLKALDPTLIQPPSQASNESLHESSTAEAEWVAASVSGRLVYQDPRLLHSTPKLTTKAKSIQQSLPIRLQPSGKTIELPVESRWEPRTTQ